MWCLKSNVDDANAGLAQVGSTCNIATYSAGATTSGISDVAIDGDTFATQCSNFAVYASFNRS